VKSERGVPNSRTRHLYYASLNRQARAWMDRAKCQGLDLHLFFPERGQTTNEAKAVCAACEVRFECLEYALNHDIEFGLWGGVTERKRRTLRATRKKAAQA